MPGASFAESLCKIGLEHCLPFLAEVSKGAQTYALFSVVAQGPGKSCMLVQGSLLCSAQL